MTETKIPDKIYKKIEKKFPARDFLMGRRYNKNFIHCYKQEKQEKISKFYFSVRDIYTGHVSTAVIEKENNKLRPRCGCLDYDRRKSCSHIVACLLNYYDVLYKNEAIDYTELSKKILNDYAKKTSNVIKKEIKIEIELEMYQVYNYYEEVNMFKLILKMGYDKLYKLTNRKIKEILEALENNETVVIGKKFIFNPDECYFNSDDLKLINYLKEKSERENDITSISNIKGFLPLMKDRKFFFIGYGFIDGIKEGFPISSYLQKSDKQYKIDFMLDEDYLELVKDKSYILKNNYIYHLSKKDIQLLETIEDYELEQLVFDEEDVENFSLGLLPLLKNNLEINEAIGDNFKIINPNVKLYFDLYQEKIECKLLFEYQNKLVNYFDTNVIGTVRNYDFENKVIEDISKFFFQTDEKKKCFVLENTELIVEFIEECLTELSNKYEVFTSEKLKKVKIHKNVSLSTTFSIGEDNIFKYDFDLGKISEKELDKVLSSMKNKKKYYRLKNGDIINLENEKLKQLDDLIEEMDIDTNKLSGEIPKYRALYLNEAKQNKYSIVKTNSLFEKFIDNFKQNKNNNLTFTKDELAILRDYQVTGIKWLYKIHKCDFGGILADEMGLGKSIQIIYLFKKLLEEDKNSKFLIVVPTSLVYNWEQEFMKFGKNLSYEVFADNKNKRHELLEKTNTNIYITSYHLLREDIEYYKNIDFKICVIDEAQNIKNPKALISKSVKKIKAQTKLALTGTPIENSIIELWSIFDFLMPGFLNNEAKFSSKYRIHDFDEESNLKLKNLNELITPFILRRKKKDVVKDLPEKIENNIYIELTSEEKKIYASMVKKYRSEMDNLIEAQGYLKARFMILSLLTKLRQLCISPKLVLDGDFNKGSKLDNLINILKELISNNHKILLFSSFKTALELVETELKKENISFYKIYGDVPSKKRMELVNNFNQNDVSVFLITLKSGGTGLNLTSADVVIHLDLWWNPQVENQATDRTHRIGQEKTVEVIKLIVKGTVEEKILELQNKKRMLSDKIIEGNVRSQNVLEKLSEEDVRNLFKYDD